MKNSIKFFLGGIIFILALSYKGPPEEKENIQMNEVIEKSFDKSQSKSLIETKTIRRNGMTYMILISEKDIEIVISYVYKK